MLVIPAIAQLFQTKFARSGTEYSPLSTQRNEPGAMKYRYSGTQSRDATRAMAAAIRRYKNVRAIASTKRMLPSSARVNSGPVSQPPLNSPAPRSSKCTHATAMQSKQLEACHSSCFPNFAMKSPSLRGQLWMIELLQYRKRERGERQWPSIARWNRRTGCRCGRRGRCS